MKSSTAAVGGGILGTIATGLAGVAIYVLNSTTSVEGQYNNNPRDSGGETNHGITVAVARQNGYEGSMRELPLATAHEIYLKDYIVKPGYLPLLELSPALGHKIVDIGVNAGPGRASCWLQEAINDLSRGGRDYAKVTQDCAVGPQTINAYKALEKRRGRVKACEMVIKLVESSQTQHYRRLSNADEFLVGWVDHRIGIVPYERCEESTPKE